MAPTCGGACHKRWIAVILVCDPHQARLMCESPEGRKEQIQDSTPTMQSCPVETCICRGGNQTTFSPTITKLTCDGPKVRVKLPHEGQLVVVQYPVDKKGE